MVSPNRGTRLGPWVYDFCVTWRNLIKVKYKICGSRQGASAFVVSPKSFFMPVELFSWVGKYFNLCDLVMMDAGIFP